MLKTLLRRPAVQAALAALFTGYLRLVRATSRLSYDPPDFYRRLDPDLPIIVTFWHGEHFLMPFLRRPHDRVKSLISRHRDGEINALVVTHFGFGLIRGSGSQGVQNPGKRGAAALVEMVRALREGYTITTTADIPKVAKVAGPGVILLAKKSGRAIYPGIVVSSRRLTFRRSWDRSKLALPFGRIVLAMGEPVRVAPDADASAMEEARITVETRLNELMERAYALADRRSLHQG